MRVWCHVLRSWQDLPYEAMARMQKDLYNDESQLFRTLEDHLKKQYEIVASIWYAGMPYKQHTWPRHKY